MRPPYRWTSRFADGARCALMRVRWFPLLGGVLVLIGGLATVGWLALAPVAPRPPGERELVYVIPKGAAARLGSPDQYALPSTVRLMMGVRDILVLRNDDVVPMQLGPVRLAPGQTYRLPFHQPGALQLACSFHQGISFLILIDPPPPPGWARLLWRLGWSNGYGAEDPAEASPEPQGLLSCAVCWG